MVGIEIPVTGNLSLFYMICCSLVLSIVIEYSLSFVSCIQIFFRWRTSSWESKDGVDKSNHAALIVPLFSMVFLRFPVHLSFFLLCSWELDEWAPAWRRPRWGGKGKTQREDTWPGPSQLPSQLDSGRRGVEHVLLCTIKWCKTTRIQAIASRLEAIASRLEAISLANVQLMTHGQPLPAGSLARHPVPGQLRRLHQCSLTKSY